MEWPGTARPGVAVTEWRGTELRDRARHGRAGSGALKRSSYGVFLNGRAGIGTAGHGGVR